jgi:hypothetical protein
MLFDAVLHHLGAMPNASKVAVNSLDERIAAVSQLLA